jgi:hypothetical protein
MFQKGNWQQLPSVCTRDLVLTYLRCAQWGTFWFVSCIKWV